MERQLNPTFAFRLGYVGNATRKNVINLDANAPIYTPGAGVDTASIACRRPYQPYRIAGTCNYSGYAGSAGPDRTAGKTFGAISTLTPALNANYNSLQGSVRGRIGDKFNMLASYVWSRTLSYDGPIVDNTDIRKNYGLADTDVRHRFVISYTYRFSDPKILGALGKQVLGGWRVNGVTIVQSGSPFTVTSGSDTNLDGTNNDRADVSGDPYSHVKGRQAKINQGILNPAAFSVPTGPYGSSRRNNFIGPGNVNTNLSLFKEFGIWEELKLQFRAESFNVFGNVNLNNPRTNYSVFSTLPVGQKFITGAGDPRRMQFAIKLLF